MTTDSDAEKYPLGPIAQRALDQIEDLLIEAGIDDFVFALKDPDTNVMTWGVHGSSVWALGAAEVIRKRSWENHIGQQEGEDA